MHARTGRRKRGQQAGFTLVEVMVSILLAAIAASGVIGLYTAVTRSSSYSRHATEASILAEDQMERLRTELAPTTGNDGGTIDEKGKLNGSGIFTRSWTITNQGTFADIVITVAWNEDGATRQVVVRSKRNI